MIGAFLVRAAIRQPAASSAGGTVAPDAERNPGSARRQRVDPAERLAPPATNTAATSLSRFDARAGLFAANVGPSLTVLHDL
jgi:hypothetical protein